MAFLRVRSTDRTAILINQLVIRYLTLTGLLTASPCWYNIRLSSRVYSGGNKFDAAGVRRQAYNLYFEDGWKATPRTNRVLQFAVRSGQGRG